MADFISLQKEELNEVELQATDELEEYFIRLRQLAELIELAFAKFQFKHISSLDKAAIHDPKVAKDMLAHKFASWAPANPASKQTNLKQDAFLADVSIELLEATLNDFKE
jgi:hypothetical protein